MKTIIGVNNLTSSPVSANLAKSAAEAVLLSELKAKNGEFEVSIAFVGRRRIRELNRQYRKTDVPTDVLSFCEDDFLARRKTGKLREREFLGELAIYYGRVKADAKESGASEKEELAWVVVHGILHLLGYDHEKNADEAAKMRKKEKKYLLALSFQAPSTKHQITNNI